jgi:UDPglucose 6-dehydrogenase
MREAPALSIIAALASRGARVVAYDPVAMTEARRIFGDTAGLAYADSPMDAVEGADALVIVTEWKAFRSPDFARIRSLLKTPAIFDGRNLYEPSSVEAAGLAYYGVGRGRSLRVRP